MSIGVERYNHCFRLSSSGSSTSEMADRFNRMSVGSENTKSNRIAVSSNLVHGKHRAKLQFF